MTTSRKPHKELLSGRLSIAPDAGGHVALSQDEDSLESVAKLSHRKNNRIFKEKVKN
jgi:hypothetical protein